MALDLAAIRARLAAQIAWTPPHYAKTPLDDVDALIGEVERLTAIAEAAETQGACMKPTSITVSFGRTQSLSSYSNIKPAITLSADLEDGDDPEACRAALLEQARTFVEEQIDLALEADGTPAKFSSAPRYKVLYVAERWIDGLRRQTRVTPPERLILIVPMGAQLAGGRTPWWSEIYSPTRDLRLRHAQARAAEWQDDHDGVRIIDCAGGDLERIPAWVFAEPTAQAEPGALVPAQREQWEDDAEDAETEDQAEEEPEEV
jgi:hypothetical protein